MHRSAWACEPSRGADVAGVSPVPAQMWLCSAGFAGSCCPQSFSAVALSCRVPPVPPAPPVPEHHALLPAGCGVGSSALTRNLAQRTAYQQFEAGESAPVGRTGPAVVSMLQHGVILMQHSATRCNTVQQFGMFRVARLRQTRRSWASTTTTTTESTTERPLSQPITPKAYAPRRSQQQCAWHGCGSHAVHSAH